MKFPAFFSEPFQQHAYVCHRGEFQHDEPAYSEKFIFQLQHIRTAMLQKEHFRTSRIPSGRIQEYHVRTEIMKQLSRRSLRGLSFFQASGTVTWFTLQAFRHYLHRAYRNAGTSELPEIPFCSFRKYRIHFVVQDLAGCCGKCPGIHTQPSCQVSYRPDSVSGCQCGLVQGGIFRAALFRRQSGRICQSGTSVP